MVNAYTFLNARLTMHTETARIEHNDSADVTLSYPFWCIVRCLPNSQTSTIAQFDSRTAAENHVQFLAKMSPDTTYNVVFEFGLG